MSPLENGLLRFEFSDSSWYFLSPHEIQNRSVNKAYHHETPRYFERKVFACLHGAIAPIASVRNVMACLSSCSSATKSEQVPGQTGLLVKLSLPVEERIHGLLLGIVFQTSDTTASLLQSFQVLLAVHCLYRE